MPSHGKNLHHLILTHHIGEGATVFFLDLFRFRSGCPETVGNIVGQVDAPQGQHRCVLDTSIPQDSHIGGSPADINQGYPQFFFLLREHRIGRGQRFQYDIQYVQPRTVAALDDVLCRGDCPGNDVDSGFEPDS